MGCEKPIIQAPMAGAQDSRLAIAVCNAGGMGSLPCAMLNTEQIEREIKNIQSNTSSPFNVNFFAHNLVEYTPTMERKWYKVLKPYYEAFGLTENDISSTGGRQPFNQETADLIADLKVPLVSFHFGLPNDVLLKQVKDSGAKVISTATTIAEAAWLQSKGVDAIIAQGLEAGGHRGMFLSHDISTQSGTFSLLPNLVKSVDLPVIAAGGISDRITAQCAFALGADAIQVGTAFLLADEATTKTAHRQALQRESVNETRLTNIFSGGIARGIKNQFIADLGIHKDAPPFPYASFITDPLKQNAERLGNHEFSAMWAGQNACFAKPGQAEEILRRIVGS
ncbi:MAG: 2-nitropropane dioxygenase [Proteobacteria bacterium]|nr:MAG: 2-nitropropane dioxygenase [Pseudomonadota bacterium]